MKQKPTLTHCILATLLVTAPLVAHGQMVGPCQAVADTDQPEFAISTAFDGTNFLVGVRGNSTHADAVGAQLLSPTGARLGSLIRTGRLMDGFANGPRVAFGSTNYLMAWSDAAVQHPSSGDDIYAQFISSAGNLVGNPFPVSTAGGSQYVLGVASDGDTFLVIWSDIDGLHGRRISPSGQLLGEELLFTTESVEEPGTVAYGGGQYLVAWVEGTDGAHQAMGRFVSTAGQLGGLLLLSQDDSHFYNPISVAFGGDRFLAVWHHNTGEDTDWDLRGRVVLSNGTLEGGELILAAGPKDDLAWANAVAFDGQDFLVAWTSAEYPFPTTNCVFLGQYWSRSGAAQSSPFVIDGRTAVSIGVGLSSGQGKVMTLINSELFTAEADVYTRTISRPGPQPLATFTIATTSGIESGFEAACDGSNYLVGIQGGSLGQGPISAQLLSPTGARLGLPLALSESGGMPHLAFDGVNYLMVWDGAKATPGFNGQFVSRTAGLVGPILRIHPDTPRASSLAFGAGSYLACWSDAAAVRGQFITPQGQFEGTSFLVSGGVQHARENAIGFDGTNFLVAFNGGGNMQPNIYGQFVSPAGTLIGGPVLLDGTPDPSDNPLAVAFDGTNYLVVFNDQVGGISEGTMHVYGRMVSAEGVVSAQRLVIADQPVAQLFPGVAFDGSSYLVSWSELTAAANLKLTLRFFDPSGRPRGPELSPFLPDAQNRPVFGATIFDGERFLVTGVLANLAADWSASSADVYGVFVARSQAMPRLEVLAPPSQSQLPLRLHGTPGINYLIQISTNLAAPEWEGLSTHSPVYGVVDFTDPNATNNQRWYRAAGP